MKNISADEYYDLVMNGFHEVTPVEHEDLTIMSEKIFKLQWFNSVHFNSYISYTDNLDAELLLTYISRCRQLQEKKRNWTANLMVCNAVVICEKAGRDAINIALMRPRFHLMIDTFPVVADLKNGEIHYYNGTMYQRLLCNRYERVYIDEHFGKPLRNLKK